MTIRSNHIAGRWVEGPDAVPNINPSDTDDVVGHYARADAAQVSDAIGAAAEAFAGWSVTTGQARADILETAASEVRARQEELADLLAREEGKTIGEARGEVDRTVRVIRYHAAQALMPVGEVVHSIRPGVKIDVVREPVGVVGVITPWNFPLAIPAWKIIPALAYGNTVVFKPADLVPASAWELVDILVGAGLPAGVLNLTMGQGSVVGDAITRDPRVAAVSFTGSVPTGARVLEATQSHQARVQLEMGGKNPLIISDDADLEIAVSVAVEGSFGSTGQRCTAAERFIVDERIHDAFVEALTVRMSALVVGDARDPRTQMGPVVDGRQLEQNQLALRRAAADSGQVIGGELVGASRPGFYMRPAAVIGTHQADWINTEEVFGPVVSIVKSRDHDEAVALANDTEFGLSSGIVTTSLAKAADFQRRSKAGMVMVNVPTAGVDYHVPFGGRARSSYGPREQGTYAREFYTTVKTNYVAWGTV
ncbi:MULTISPECIES: aldehyde dehydrogenase family protein [unclassified Microbacterium]|uniref:aldehyde dehydrogenase family protein n=1 Tax=unclassified Microbacterium TaxID=2609290 RepID=UPI00214B8963|nr:MULTISPECIES: aldehyde dehydrogenase family protein [unclassified Microbacterium]MCR2811332.1 aldehyde dehydrogenase family protein [Microbacterium sp. zg.B185]WIM19489.1 aldehyde dehydrogenase family protein [Microbacterium sp. zg-B185]